MITPIDIDNFLEALSILRETCPEMSKAFTEGGCIQFAIAMQKIIPDAEILYDLNHAVVRVGDIVFDVNGLTETNNFSRSISLKTEGEKRWLMLTKLRPLKN